MQGQKTLPQAASLLILRCGCFLKNWDSRTLGQTAHRRWKIQMLVFHDETEHAPPGPAAETVVVLTRRIHMEGWRFLSMEGTKRPEARSGALEREIGTNQVNDVVCIADALDCFFGNEPHGLKIPCGDCACE